MKSAVDSNLELSLPLRLVSTCSLQGARNWDGQEMSEVFGDAFLFLIFCQSFLKFYWDENQNCFSGYRKPIGSGGEKTRRGVVAQALRRAGGKCSCVCAHAHADCCGARPLPSPVKQRKHHHTRSLIICLFVCLFSHSTFTNNISNVHCNPVWDTEDRHLCLFVCLFL